MQGGIAAIGAGGGVPVGEPLPTTQAENLIPASNGAGGGQEQTTYAVPVETSSTQSSTPLSSTEGG